MLFSSILVAQTHQHQLGVGMSYVALDLPDDLVFMHRIVHQYAIRKRFFWENELGLINYNGTDNTFEILPEKRRRICVSSKLKYAIVKYKNNHLKIFGGTSIWYRNYKIVDQIKIKAEAPNFEPQIVSYNTNILQDVNIGYNIGSEIEIGISKKLSIVGGLTVTNFKRLGVNSLLHLNLLYRF
jgi:hypothetical protein